MCHAFRWFRRNCDGVASVIVNYDSEYAAKVTQRVWRARSNLALVVRTRAAYDAVSAMSVVHWRKVSSHIY